jgi:hypothetical protein
MKVVALTLTNGRPECLALCQKYVARQSLPVDEHVIAEGHGFWENLAEALPRLPTGQNDVVVVFEDDDWYHQDWVRTCVNRLIDPIAGEPECDLFGQGSLNYYHVPTGGWFSKPSAHGQAPMHATAWRGPVTNKVRSLPRADKFGHKPILDVVLWQNIPRNLTIPGRRVVSMKGMPGTPGYSNAHLASTYKQVDTTRAALRAFVGDDIVNYEPYFNRA